MELDYSKPGPELMVGLINKSNGTLFKVADLTFSDIGNYSDPEHPDKNTKITATGTGTTRFKGPKDLFYRRLDLQASIGGRNINFEVKAGGSSLESVLLKMNERYKLGFDTTDISWDQSGPITGTVEATLTAVPTSYTYIGTAKINLTALPADNSIIVPPATEDGEVDEQFQTPGGDLLAGQGNPAGGLILTSNGEVQFGGAMRKYNNVAVLPQASPGHYDIALAAGEDWNFPLVFGLVDQRNADRLIDLYDVGLKIECIDSSKSLDFVLAYNASTKKYEFRDAANSLNITDGVTNANATAYQDIQRLIFYKTELGVTQLSASGVPLGEYTFEFHATRKIAGSQPLTQLITVNVTEA